MQRTATLTPANKKGATLDELTEFVQRLKQPIDPGSVPESARGDAKVRAHVTLGGGLRSLTVSWVDGAE